MTGTIAVIMAAHNAEATIARAANSMLPQSFDDWLLVVVADDGRDYEAVLGRAGLCDPRFRFLATEAPRSGACRARNIALEIIDADFAAVLDADDLFKPQKLARSWDASGSRCTIT